MINSVEEQFKNFHTNFFWGLNYACLVGEAVGGSYLKPWLGENFTKLLNGIFVGQYFEQLILPNGYIDYAQENEEMRENLEEVSQFSIKLQEACVLNNFECIQKAKTLKNIFYYTFKFLSSSEFKKEFLFSAAGIDKDLDLNPWAKEASINDISFRLCYCGCNLNVREKFKSAFEKELTKVLLTEQSFEV